MSEIQLDWFAGAGAQIEVFSPDVKAAAEYRVKYTPPFRTTIRPPMERLHLGPGELDPLNQQLEQVVKVVHGARGSGGAAPAAPGAIDNQLQLAGSQLFDLIIPHDVAVDLRKPGLYLEFGVDDDLVQYPWELMHDGDEYIALKHYIGRYVNSNIRTSMPFNATATMGAEKLKVLLVCVSNPQPREAGKGIPKLQGAEAEAEKLIEELSDIEEVELSLLKDNAQGNAATFDNVYRALRAGCHIFHYTGHAYFDPAAPYRSSLMLWDRDMSTGQLSKFIGRKAPVLCFINGCESTMTTAWGENYDIFSLAQAFLSTGTYLLGSRWKLGDTEAAEFAADFYRGLLKEKKSIGRAVQEARKKLKENGPANSFAWASYVLYADPRVCFRWT
jgi:CHAT domain-containing protein